MPEHPVRLGHSTTAKRIPCRKCSVSHISRDRRPGLCLECDIAARIASGEDAAAVARALELPAFLIVALGAGDE